MQLGIFARTFHRPTLEETFDAVAEHGLHCVQFNMACVGLPTLPDHIENGVVDNICQASANREIDIAAVSGTYNMIHPDPYQCQVGLQRLPLHSSGTESRRTQIQVARLR